MHNLKGLSRCLFLSSCATFITLCIFSAAMTKTNLSVRLDPLFGSAYIRTSSCSTTSLTDQLNSKCRQPIASSLRPPNLPVIARVTDVSDKTMVEAAAKVADSNKTVLIAVVDSAFIEMAFNFFLTSIVKYNISNYLILSTDDQSCPRFQTYQANCVLLINDSSGHDKTVWGTPAFKRKMNYRPAAILQLLQNGFNVLHSDTDIVFLDNPFHHITCDTDCDIAYLDDGGYINAGFLFVRSTVATTEVYQSAITITDNNPNIDDQSALNSAADKISNIVRRNYTFNTVVLPRDKFLCGLEYWENTRRRFIGDSPCSKCVVIHNNWIVSFEAKRYRFRESGMWIYDGNGYYSDPNRNYLRYEQPSLGSNINETKRLENTAFINALAISMVTNRTLILPRFRCGQKQNTFCNFLDKYKIQNFETIFTNYRENSFLQNPLIPNTTSKSVTPECVLKRDGEVLVLQTSSDNIVFPGRVNGTIEEISKLLSKVDQKVLTLKDLHTITIQFAENQASQIIKESEKNALEQKLLVEIDRTTYRQYK